MAWSNSTISKASAFHANPGNELNQLFKLKLQFDWY